MKHLYHSTCTERPGIGRRSAGFELPLVALAFALLGAMGPFRQTAQAQDIHFSQIHASPTFLNPAMTGLFSGDYRVGANFRQQWRSATANYRTLACSADGRVMDIGETGMLSLGMNLFADRAGDLDFTTSSAMFTVGAARRLNERGDHLISVAIQGGILHQYVDYSKLAVFDIEPVMLQGNGSAAQADVSVGLAWTKRLGEKHRIYAGGALFHIAEPDLAMVGQVSGYRESLARRGVFHGGGSFTLNDRWTAMPSFIYLEQSPHRENTLGTFMEYRYAGQERRAQPEDGSIYFGAWFRWFYRPDISSGSDAVILAARWDKNRVSYGFSYDINISSLTRASRGFGGPELSIIYIGEGRRDQSRTRKHKVDCPKF